MPYAGMPVVRDGMLEIPGEENIPVGSPAWFAWLQTAERFSYAYSPLYRFTVRREKRRNTFYWFAYLKIESKLHNGYVGKTEGLTRERLDDVSKRILERI